MEPDKEAAGREGGGSLYSWVAFNALRTLSVAFDTQAVGQATRYTKTLPDRAQGKEL